MDYVIDIAGARERCTFEELRRGDKVYEVIETKQRISIVPRLVEMSNNIGKKTHFTLRPFQGLKDCKYCPYSNKSYTVSKQFNPIFLSYNMAYSYIRQKLANDIKHSEMVVNRIKSKYNNFCFHERLARRNSTSDYSTSIGDMSCMSNRSTLIETYPF